MFFFFYSYKKKKKKKKNWNQLFSFRVRIRSLALFFLYPFYNGDSKQTLKIWCFSIIFLRFWGILLQYFKIEKKSAKSVIINIPNISQRSFKKRIETYWNEPKMFKKRIGNILWDIHLNQFQSKYVEKIYFMDWNGFIMDWFFQSVSIRFLNPFKSVLIHYKSVSIHKIYFCRFFFRFGNTATVFPKISKIL